MDFQKPVKMMLGPEQPMPAQHPFDMPPPQLMINERPFLPRELLRQLMGKGWRTVLKGMKPMKRKKYHLSTLPPVLFKVTHPPQPRSSIQVDQESCNTFKNDAKNRPEYSSLSSWLFFFVTPSALSSRLMRSPILVTAPMNTTPFA